MRKPPQIQPFSFSFIDLFSCAFAGMILVMILFTSEDRIGRTGQLASIAVLHAGHDSDDVVAIEAVSSDGQRLSPIDSRRGASGTVIRCRCQVSIPNGVGPALLYLTTKDEKNPVELELSSLAAALSDDPKRADSAILYNTYVGKAPHDVVALKSAVNGFLNEEWRPELEGSPKRSDLDHYNDRHRLLVYVRDMYLTVASKDAVAERLGNHIAMCKAERERVKAQFFTVDDIKKLPDDSFNGALVQNGGENGAAPAWVVIDTPDYHARCSCNERRDVVIVQFAAMNSGEHVGANAANGSN